MSSVATSMSIASPQWHERLAASQAWCRAITQQRAANFYHGMKLVAGPKRTANYALYAWMRIADDLADEGGSIQDKQAALANFRRNTERAIDPDLPSADDLPEGMMWPAVRDMALTYNLPHEYLHAMIDGQLLDQEKTRYRTFDELYDYCYKVASVVGLSCIEIWGYDGGAATRQLSEYRGIAFQLTNILRDVMEDAGRDRAYMPAEDFGVFDLSPLMFTMAKPADVAVGLRKVAKRAKHYYDASAALEEHVHADGRACLWAMTQIYRRLLDKVLADPTVVLRQRVRLGSLRKGMIAVSASCRRRLRK